MSTSIALKIQSLQFEMAGLIQRQQNELLLKNVQTSRTVELLQISQSKLSNVVVVVHGCLSVLGPQTATQIIQVLNEVVLQCQDAATLMVGISRSVGELCQQEKNLHHQVEDLVYLCNRRYDSLETEFKKLAAAEKSSRTALLRVAACIRKINEQRGKMQVPNRIGQEETVDSICRKVSVIVDCGPMFDRSLIGHLVEPHLFGEKSDEAQKRSYANLLFSCKKTVIQQRTSDLRDLLLELRQNVVYQRRGFLQLQRDFFQQLNKQLAYQTNVSAPYRPVQVKLQNAIARSSSFRASFRRRQTARTVESQPLFDPGVPPSQAAEQFSEMFYAPEVLPTQSNVHQPVLPSLSSTHDTHGSLLTSTHDTQVPLMTRTFFPQHGASSTKTLVDLRGPLLTNTIVDQHGPLLTNTFVDQHKYLPTNTFVDQHKYLPTNTFVDQHGPLLSSTLEPHVLDRRLGELLDVGFAEVAFQVSGADRLKHLWIQQQEIEKKLVEAQKTTCEISHLVPIIRGRNLSAIPVETPRPETTQQSHVSLRDPYVC